VTTRAARQPAGRRKYVRQVGRRNASGAVPDTRRVGKFDEAESSLPDVPYADWAKLLGMDGARIDHPDQIEAVLDAASAADRPFVIDAVVDANVPLVPPHLTAIQVLLTAKVEFSGDRRSSASTPRACARPW
jgi:pyruvate dehydrogenase (quinone)